MAERAEVLGLKVLFEGQNPCVEYVPNLDASQKDLCNDYYVFLSIVAVHGLGASPDWAWIRKAKDGNEAANVNWLTDENMLPAKLPDSRIMTFNYESKWLLGAPKQRRSLCAIQLLNALDNKREAVTTPSSRMFTLISLTLGRREVRNIDH